MLWIVKKAFYRIVQMGLRLATYFLDWREPTLLKGAGSIKKLPEAIKKQNIKSVLIVTDKVIESLGLMKSLLAGLDEAGIKYIVFNEVQPNPSVENIEDARKLYLDNACGGFIAFGGGSPIDCAKVAAARITNPKKTVKKMRGILRVTHKLPPLFAVPTTAGTGSESTIAAVVKDMKTHEKYAITDAKLRPRYAVLDPELTVGLPPHITGATGMDALTHAVEAFIGKSNTKYTAECARKAVKIIFENIEKVYTDGRDLHAREQMLIASNYAGLAFTRAYVGYVHAIAHTLGGIYNTPHGYANAVVLPFVLEYFDEKIHPQLAELADIAGVSKEGQNTAEKANAFIAAIKELKKILNIPEHIEEIKDEDIPLIVKRALHEANPLYPVPKIMKSAECTEVVKKIKG
jgi:alcohol dehydrogenase